MLHPIEMFDGEKSQRDPGTMPLLASRDLRSPVATLRLEATRISRELDAERKRVTEKDAAISRLERECAAAKSSWAPASAEAKRLGDQIVQLRAALDDEAARAAAAETEIGELRDARAQWNAELGSLECSLASVRASAGLWIEQDSQAVQRLRSELDAVVREREQAAAERDRVQDELTARMDAWEKSRWRKFRALLMRAWSR
jgi:chromosome segregation ATPase